MNLTDWINSTLYPTLFESIDSVFREHSFNKYRGNWRSSTYMNGEKHSNKEKTVITKRKPTRILEQGGGSKTLIDYVMERDGYTEPIEAIKWLASSVGLELPNSSNFDAGAYQEQKERLELLEECNNFFIESLTIDPNAKETLSYLESRGYSRENIEFMELGYIPSQMALHKHLETKGYSKTLIEEALHLHKDIGVVNKLSIPFRSGNSIKGFIFRSLDKEQKNKYINSTGLKRGDNLFNLSSLKGDKDITVVEGYLDALIATARGVENVVALGGASISPSGIQDAIRKGVKSFTLCLDNDAGGTTGTKQTVEALLREGVNRIYVVALPAGEAKIDPDDVIREEGVERFKEILSTAIPYYLHNLNNIFTRYANIEKVEERALTFKEIDKLLEEVVAGSVDIVEPIDKERYKATFLKQPFTTSLGITEESIERTLKNIAAREAQKDAIKELTLKTREIEKALKEENTKEAFKLVKQAQKLEAQATELSTLYKVTTREDIVRRAKETPNRLYSGYTVETKEGEPHKIMIPNGALTVVAGATGHGKSTLLYNMALNIVEATDKRVHFFTLEEHSDELIKKTLISYINRRLKTNFARNCEEAIGQYYKYGNETLINSEHRARFKELEAEFYSNFIENEKLKFDFSSYDCETLVQAIYSLKDNTNIGAIFIDYIQIINLRESKNSSRQMEVKAIMQQLKDVSVNTALPIVVGSQFNRYVKNHLELVNTNLGEAGDIERGAHLILAIWNNNDPNKKISETEATNYRTEISSKGYDLPNTLYLKTLKNRGGRVDIAGLLSWNGNTKVVESLTATERDEIERENNINPF